MRLLCGAAIGSSLPAIPRSRPSVPFPQIHSFRLPSRRLSIRPRPQRRRCFPPLSMATQPHSEPMKLLFVEMGVGYDQHGQDITAAAMRACKDAISSNSIPAFRRGSIPGVNSDQMKLQIKLGVPRSAQSFLDVERVKSVFP